MKTICKCSHVVIYDDSYRNRPLGVWIHKSHLHNDNCECRKPR